MARKKHGDGFAFVDDGVVGWFSGGEPVNGCDLVSVLVFAPTPAEATMRVREIGLWSAYVMDRSGKPDPVGVAAALVDPDAFVWNHADGGAWLPSSDLPRP